MAGRVMHHAEQSARERARQAADLSPEEMAVLQAVVYSSVFCFPLTPDEVAHAAPDAALTSGRALRVYDQSPSLKRVLEYREGHFCLSGKRAWLRLRRWRRRHTLRCFQRNRLLLQLIACIPGTRLVAISGSAAHLNCGREADIDLFLVTRGRRVWSSAVTALLLSRLFARRRVICFNYLISDQRLRLTPEDAFTANQLIHLKPITGRETFQQLLEQNPFVQRLHPGVAAASRAPQAWLEKLRPPAWMRRAQGWLELLWLRAPGALLEWGCRRLYRWHLHRQAPQ